MRLNIVKMLTICLLGLAIIGFLFLLYSAWRTRQTADNILRDVQGFRVGKTSFQEVESFRQRYSSYVSYAPNKPKTCSAEACWFSVGVDNPLASLILKKSGFSSGIAFNKGSLQEVDVAASCAGADSKFVPTFVVQVKQAVDNPQFRGGAAGSGNGFFFDLGPSATQEQVAAVYGLDLGFLDRFGGCHDATEMFVENPRQWPPSLWEQNTH
jgi:hypothetical protein